MAENKRPLIVVDSPPKRINFATIKKQRTIAKNNLQSPMAGDRNYNVGGVDTGDNRLSVLVDTARMQLISPPPEEMLRKNPRLGVQSTPSLLANTGTSPVNPPTHGTIAAAKRKRTQPAPASTDVDSMNQDNDLGVQSPQPTEATPNPKPRKQGRLHSRQPSFESPTRTSFGHSRSSPVSNDDLSKQHTPSRSNMKKVLVKSPHAKNPNADFIDDMPLPALVLPAAKASGSALRRTLLGTKSSRRSATPIPPYEPPTDVFTPPREVFLSPVVMSKSSKRKTATFASGSKSAKGKRKGSILTVVTPVKQELPDIDLNLPMPPPSPTDDPLLLSGPPDPEFDFEPTPPRRREMSVQAQAEQEAGVRDRDLPPSSPEPPLATDDAEAVRIFDWTRNENAAPETSTDESMMRLDPDDADVSPVRLFDTNDVPPNSDGGWSDSDDEGGQEPTFAPGVMDVEGEGEGEYTGRWKMMLVRTKQDPPSSATRGRMEEWGRPISPFPTKVERLAFLEEEVEDDEGHQEVDHQQERSQQEEEYMRREEEEREEEEVRRMSVEPEQLLGNVADSADVSLDAEHLQDTRDLELSKNRTEPNVPHDVQQSPCGLLDDVQQENEEEEREVCQNSAEFDDNEEHASSFDDLAPVQFTENPACENQTVQEDEDEEQEVRQLSVEFDDDEEDAGPFDDLVPVQFTKNPACENQAAQEDEEEREVRQLSVEFDDDQEHASSFDDFVPLQFTENPAYENQVVSIPAFQPCRQSSPAPAIEAVVFPSIGSSPEAVPSSHSTGLGHGITPAANFRENHRTQTIVLAQGEDDDQSSDEGDELSLVKITSADPRAAARAAAILKQHDYDCYTNIEMKRRHLEAKHRRNSHSDIGDFAKEFRRRDISSSGVAKTSNSRRRRSTLGMGVTGDKVFIPGTPAITLPELLQEAELEVRDSPQSLSQRSLVLAERGDPFKTPIAAKYRTQTANMWMADQKAELYGGDIDEREWTKEDWKHLDACFTDQRLEVGSRLADAEQDLLAPVDIVSINDVVDRFVVSKGGLETVAKFGELWSRENLLERTRALQKKQRSGHIAAPTTPYTPLSVGSNSNVLGGKERAPHMQVPDFTPLGRRAAPPRKSRPTLQQSITPNIASKNLTPEQEGPVIPPTLLAPRYSHLLEEAITISQQGLTLPPGQETRDSSPHSEIEDMPHSYDVPSTTIGKRVKGFLFSYLPTLKSSSTAKKTQVALQPGLPLPPPDILSKPRGPVITPARAPLSKPKHPKELVVLHPAPQPPKISHIPRMIKPRRLVELHPPPPPPIIEPAPFPRPRRSSGNSVKDLVRGFEEIQALTHDELKRTKSNEGWKRCADKRPHWKP